MIDRPDGLYLIQQLSPAEIAAIAALAERCNSHDGIELKFNPEIVAARPNAAPQDLIVVRDGRIVGFLGLFSFDPVEHEAVAMVEPELRRRGIAMELAERARDHVRAQGAERLLWIVPASSAPGQAWIKRRPTVYRFSEHLLEHRGTLPDGALPPTLPVTDLTPENAPQAAALLEEGFGMARPEALLERDLKTPGRSMLLIGDPAAPSACIGLSLHGDEGYIYGFVVAKALRGQGLGRQILKHAVRRLHTMGAKTIALEVTTTNANALGLYESCGFVQVSTYDYFAEALQA